MKIFVTVTSHVIGICKKKYDCKTRYTLSGHRCERTNMPSKCSIFVNLSLGRFDFTYYYELFNYY